MSVPRETFYENFAEARKFVVSQRGAILHENGHYAAANSESLVAGHCVIEATTAEVTGGFVFDVGYAKAFFADTERCAFTAAAGAVTELYFCNNTHMARLGPDIVAYCKLLRKTPPNLTAQDVVSVWQHEYISRIETLAASIEANYERCVAYCGSKRFLIAGYHVIPTCFLRPPCRRTPISHMAEVRHTWPKAARQRALDRFLSGQFAGGSALGTRPNRAP